MVIIIAHKKAVLTLQLIQLFIYPRQTAMSQQLPRSNQTCINMNEVRARIITDSTLL